MNKLQNAVAVTLLSLVPVAVFAAGDAAEGQNKSAVCHACHGADGKSTQPIYPNLGGQQQNYLSKALHDFRDGGRQDPVMNGFAASLSDADIEDIAAWYASRQGLTEIKDK
ncbi:MAG: c-type cytochrome [Xanthomonadales bacterium]|nr:c-type cytochrome [Xanthomonadales bacterium]